MELYQVTYIIFGALLVLMGIKLMHSDWKLETLKVERDAAEKQLDAGRDIIADLTEELESMTNERDIYRGAYRDLENKNKEAT